MRLLRCIVQMDSLPVFQGSFIGLSATELRDNCLFESLIKCMGSAVTYCVTVRGLHTSHPCMELLCLKQDRYMHNLCGRKITISSC